MSPGDPTNLRSVMVGVVFGLVCVLIEIWAVYPALRADADSTEGLRKAAEDLREDVQTLRDLPPIPELPPFTVEDTEVRTDD